MNETARRVPAAGLPARDTEAREELVGREAPAGPRARAAPPTAVGVAPADQRAVPATALGVAPADQLARAAPATAVVVAPAGLLARAAPATEVPAGLQSDRGTRERAALDRPRRPGARASDLAGAGKGAQAGSSPSRRLEDGTVLHLVGEVRPTPAPQGRAGPVTTGALETTGRAAGARRLHRVALAAGGTAPKAGRVRQADPAKADRLVPTAQRAQVARSGHKAVRATADPGDSTRRRAQVVLGVQAEAGRARGARHDLAAPATRAAPAIAGIGPRPSAATTSLSGSTDPTRAQSAEQPAPGATSGGGPRSGRRPGAPARIQVAPARAPSGRSAGTR